MKLIPSLVGILTLLSIIHVSPSDASPSHEAVGSTTGVQPLARALSEGQARELQLDAPVYYLDELRTGESARLHVTLLDDSTITLGENAALRIDEFVYTPQDRRSLTLRLIRGALRFVGQTLDRRRDRRTLIRAPGAVLGVRGRDAWVGPIDDAIGVLAIDGEVFVSNPTGHVLLRSGEGTMIQPDGSLSPVKRWGEDKVTRALSKVRLD